MTEHPRAAPRPKWTLTDRRSPDRRAHYRIRLPERVKLLPQDGSIASPAQPVVMLGSMRARSGVPLEIDILACWQPREIAPCDWLEQVLARGGYEVLEQQRLPGRGGDDLIVTTRCQRPSPHVSIWRTVKRGGSMSGTIYLVEARTHATHGAAFADEAREWVDSFALLDPGDWPFCERLRLLARAKPGDFSFYHPASWQVAVASEVGTDDGVFLAHLIPGVQAPAGRITFIVGGGITDARRLVSIYARSLEASGGTVSFAESVTQPSFGSLDKTFVMRGSATTPDGGLLALRIDGGSRSNVGYLLALIGTSRASQPLIAAINERAMALIRETMRTHA